MKKRATPSLPINNRCGVSDREAAEFFGVSISTIRKIAEEAHAVVRYGGIRRNDLPTLIEYWNSLKV